MNSRVARWARLLLIAFAACVLATAAALAQTAAVFSVPFHFAVSDHLIPAGDYTVRFAQSPFPAHRAMTFLNRQTMKTYLIQVRPEDGPQIVTTGYLAFSSVGGEYYLKEAQIPGMSIRAILTLPRSFTDQIAANRSHAASTTLLASR